MKYCRTLDRFLNAIGVEIVLRAIWDWLQGRLTTLSSYLFTRIVSRRGEGERVLTSMFGQGLGNTKYGCGCDTPRIVRGRDDETQEPDQERVGRWTP